MGDNVGMHDWTVDTHTHGHCNARSNVGTHTQSSLERRALSREQMRSDGISLPNLRRHLVRYVNHVVPDGTTGKLLWRWNPSSVPAAN